MDLLKWSLGPSGVNLVSDECLVTYLDEFDFLDGGCFSATLSKGLGLAIIAGSILVKVPQIVNLMASKSAEGLSLFSVLLELFPWFEPTRFLRVRITFSLSCLVRQ